MDNNRLGQLLVEIKDYKNRLSKINAKSSEAYILRNSLVIAGDRKESLEKNDSALFEEEYRLAKFDQVFSIFFMAGAYFIVGPNLSTSLGETIEKALTQFLQFPRHPQPTKIIKLLE